MLFSGDDEGGGRSVDFAVRAPLSIVFSTTGGRRFGSRFNRQRRRGGSVNEDSRRHAHTDSFKRRVERLLGVKPSPKLRRSQAVRLKQQCTASVQCPSSSTVAGAPLCEGDDGATMLDIDATPDDADKRLVAKSSIANGAALPFNIVTINVSGLRFQTFAETLERFPATLLGDPLKRKAHFNHATGEYFFDRHRGIFEAILYIYQSRGHIKRPESVGMDTFLRELKYFEMGDEIVERFWVSEGYQKPEEPPLPKNKLMRRAWKLMEHPDSSLAARILAFVSVFVIILSISSFCIETLPNFQRMYASVNGTEMGDGASDWANPFFVVEVLCISWFTFELLTRFLSSPSKCIFMRSFLNIIDLVAILPFFVNLVLREDGGSSMSFAVLRVLRLVRVFRIFKLSRHSVGLQILGKTFRASIQEFCLLIFFMCIALVLFSSGVYFAESGRPDSDFDSIPSAFWFALVTMTTVGYGDLVPKGTSGRIVGSCCALIGVLTLALPVPIIVANFKHFYRYVGAAPVSRGAPRRQETGLANMRALEDADDAECDDAISVSS